MAKDTDRYKAFDPKSLVGRTSSGRPYLRPSSRYNQDVGLSNTMREFRRYGIGEGANLTKQNAQVIQDIIQNQLVKKSTTTFNRFDRMEMRHKLEQMYQAGQLSRSDIRDAQAIIDHMSE